MTTKTAIIVFPGSNCVDETERFLLSIFDTVPVKVWHKEGGLPDADFFVLPGGFSYGDYGRSGMLAAMSPVLRDLGTVVNDGKRVLGICNGFQILCEMGLLPGTLRINESGKFICKNVAVDDATFDEQYTLPIAHGDGNYFYTPDCGEVIPAMTYDANPNGSMNGIAGIYTKSRRVMGMMPHPERAFEKYHTSQDGIKSIWQLL